MFLTIKLCTYANRTDFFFNRTDYLRKNGFVLNNLQRLICHKTKQTKQTKLVLMFVSYNLKVIAWLSFSLKSFWITLFINSLSLSVYLLYIYIYIYKHKEPSLLNYFSITIGRTVDSCLSQRNKSEVKLVQNSSFLEEKRITSSDGVNLQSSLLRFGTRPNEWGTQWDSNSLVQVR